MRCQSAVVCPPLQQPPSMLRSKSVRILYFILIVVHTAKALMEVQQCNNVVTAGKWKSRDPVQPDRIWADPLSGANCRIFPPRYFSHVAQSWWGQLRMEDQVMTQMFLLSWVTDILKLGQKVSMFVICREDLVLTLGSGQRNENWRMRYSSLIWEKHNSTLWIVIYSHKFSRVKNNHSYFTGGLAQVWISLGCNWRGCPLLTMELGLSGWE